MIFSPLAIRGERVWEREHNDDYDEKLKVVTTNARGTRISLRAVIRAKMFRRIFSRCDFQNDDDEDVAHVLTYDNEKICIAHSRASIERF